MATRFSAVTPTARLADQVADALVAEIRRGVLGPGDKLSTEGELATQFGVSRTVVREALSRLKSLGLVDSQQGRGVFVQRAGFSPLSFDARSAESKQAVVMMVEVRRGLEAEVAALAAQRRTDEDLARIRQSVAALEQAVRAGGDGVEEDVAFHRAIGSAARNPFLMSTLDYLQQFLRGATRVTRANEARRSDFMRQVGKEHEAIVRAIEAGDPARARQAAARHMDNAIRRIGQADPAFWEQQGVQLATPLLKPPPA
jgi:GntR family transcriptional repressor for pyruvate dehydrogenase complex